MNQPPNHSPPVHRSFPWRFAQAIVILALLLTLILVLRDTLDPQIRAAHELEYYRQAQINQTLAPVDLFAAALWRLIPPILVIAAAGVGGFDYSSAIVDAERCPNSTSRRYS